MRRLDLEIAAETGVPLAAPGPVGRAHPDGGGLARASNSNTPSAG